MDVWAQNLYEKINIQNTHKKFDLSMFFFGLKNKSVNQKFKNHLFHPLMNLHKFEYSAMRL